MLRADHHVNRGTTVTAPSTTLPETQATGHAVRVRGATKVYGEGATEVRALDGVDLDVPRGQFLAIMGPSGSGKSTLLHCAAGLDRLTTGTVEIAGVRTDELSDKKLTLLRREQVGFVFQSYNLVPTLSARENITLPLDLAGADVDQAWFDRITATLDIGDRLHHSPAELSGGQQQRVAAARALVTRPAVVFADEPTGALDSRSGAGLLCFLRDVAHDAGQTAVMVTHDPVAASYADRLLFLADGRVVDELLEPTADAVLDRMKRFDAEDPARDAGGR
jgi:putative ABC transport system ATP-binding protein